MNHGVRLKVFDEVWAEQGPFLKVVLWRLTGDRDLFAEALQESLVLIWRHLEKLQGQPGRAYIYRIAQSSVSKAWRRRASASHDWLEDREVDPADRPDESVCRKELVASVQMAISELPEQQGRAITMRYLEQKDYGTMAHEMDCSEATSRSHVSKALAVLRERLGGTYERFQKGMES